jgi:hypothetical protein
MELTHTWERASSAVTQEFPSILWNLKIHYRVYKSSNYKEKYIKFGVSLLLIFYLFI